VAVALSMRMYRLNLLELITSTLGASPLPSGGSHIKRSATPHGLVKSLISPSNNAATTTQRRFTAPSRCDATTTAWRRAPSGTTGLTSCGSHRALLLAARPRHSCSRQRHHSARVPGPVHLLHTAAATGPRCRFRPVRERSCPPAKAAARRRRARRAPRLSCRRSAQPPRWQAACHSSRAGCATQLSAYSTISVWAMLPCCYPAAKSARP
jgi:hypothetical protein